MPAFIRAILWLLLVVAPGGVLLLPLLVGEAVARRKRDEELGGAPDGANAARVVASGATDGLATPVAGL